MLGRCWPCRSWRERVTARLDPTERIDGPNYGRLI
jgi:hypothetical protein